MASTFKDALAARYEAIKLNTVRSKEYGEYKVADLIAAYGSRRELAKAYADVAGVKVPSAYKALSRLERYERGERGGDVRRGVKGLQNILTSLGQNLPPPENSYQGGGGSPGSSGMGGGAVSVSGTVGVSGYGDDYDEDRDIIWDFSEDELDTMAIEAWENGEEAASNYYGDIYGFDGMNVVDADIEVY